MPLIAKAPWRFATLSAHTLILVSACAPPPTPRPMPALAPAPTSTSTSTSTSTPTPTPTSTSTPIPAPPSTLPPFDLPSWLASHSITTWKPDRACPTRTGSGGIGDCICARSVTVGSPPVDLLDCTRPFESSSPSSPFGAHTILYVADHGALRVVFDKPTALFPDEPHGPPLIRFDLLTDSDGALVVVEASGGGARASASCVDALADLRESVKSTAADQRRFPASDLAAYQELCAAVGRYSWKGGALVRAH